MTEQLTVGELQQQIADALRWAGKKNPNKVLLAKCGSAITYLAGEVERLKSTLEKL